MCNRVSSDISAEEEGEGKKREAAAEDLSLSRGQDWMLVRGFANDARTRYRIACNIT
jgi:hypothetical protein